MNNPQSKLYFELDFWLPSIHLAFEFQDDYHYHDHSWYSSKKLSDVKWRDDIFFNLFYISILYFVYSLFVLLYLYLIKF